MLKVKRLTPAGAGALAVLALYGARLPAVLRDRRGAPLPWPPPGAHRLARISDAGRVFDEVVVVGRDGGAELHLHGGEGTLAAVTSLLVSRGAEPWSGGEPGSGPVPASLAAARALVSAQAGPLAELGAAARLALARGTRDAGLTRRLDRALQRVPLGRQLVRSPRVQLVGRPNAGKSSLFNALLGRRRALVSPEPGTTRDSVRATLALEGIPVVLEDTAGQQDLRLPPVPPSSDDLLLHVLAPGQRRPPDAPGLLIVPGRVDQHPAPGGVSGLTGQGLEGLVAKLVQRLGLSADASDHAWAPTDPGLVEVLGTARALPLAGPH